MDDLTKHLHAVAAFAIAAGLTASLVPPTSAQDADPVVLQATPFEGTAFEDLAPYFGKTYAELTAEWWQWVLSIPAEVNPLGDEDGRYCAVGQEGRVWFLAGTRGGAAERRCTIPAGKAVLFPVINAECSTVEGDGETEKELRRCAKDLIDPVDEFEATVDGVAVTDDIERVVSPAFSFVLPADDILGIDQATPNPSPAVSDGYWVLLAPLSVGQHEIRFRGAVTSQDFETAVTYQLRVAPERSNASSKDRL